MDLRSSRVSNKILRQVLAFLQSGEDIEFGPPGWFGAGALRVRQNRASICSAL